MLRTFLWSPLETAAQYELVVWYKTSGLSGSHAVKPNTDRNQSTCCLVADGGNECMSPLVSGQAFTPLTWHEMVPKGDAKGHWLPPHAPLQFEFPCSKFKCFKGTNGRRIFGGFFIASAKVFTWIIGEPFPFFGELNFGIYQVGFRCPLNISGLWVWISEYPGNRTGFVPLFSLFLTSPNWHFPNFYLMTCLPAGPSPGLCLPTGSVHASLNCGKGGFPAARRQLPVSGSLLLKQLPADPCSQFLFLSQMLWLRLDIGSCMASAGDAQQNGGCHCTVPTLWVPSVSPTSLACSCQPEVWQKMSKTLLGSYTGLLLVFYVFTIF